MVTFPIFRISGSIVKPTRETLLDYCSYCLVVIALIGVARIWIGGSGLRAECPFQNVGNIANDRDSMNGQATQSINGSLEEVSGLSADLRQRGSELDSSSGDNDVGYQSNSKSKGFATPKKRIKCAKYYQSIFAYILLVESSILLFSGLMWTKVPKVSSALDRFSEVIKSCSTSDWAKKTLNIISDKGQTGDLSQSLYSVISCEVTNHNIRSFLDQLFHPENDYKSKASARHLYEKVLIFCDHYSRSTSIWYTYIVKSLVQFALWLVIFNINLVLFVVLEFYIMCPEDDTTACDHDTFLRIIWFMAETVLVIYAVLNCKTLMWINEKSIIKRGICCTCQCINKYRISYADDHSKHMRCRPYRFADNPPVYNDAAVLLHLLEEVHPKYIPYFVVFMFTEWKEKLTSFRNPVSSFSSMQMISGKPLPTIEIVDISPWNETDSALGNVKSHHQKKRHVTFFVGDETDALAKADDHAVKQTKFQPKYRSINEKLLLHQTRNESLPSLSRLRDSSTSSFSCSPGSKGDSDTNETSTLLHQSSSSESSVCNRNYNNESSQESDISESGLLIK